MELLSLLKCAPWLGKIFSSLLKFTSWLGNHFGALHKSKTSALRILTEVRLAIDDCSDQLSKNKEWILATDRFVRDEQPIPEYIEEALPGPNFNFPSLNPKDEDVANLPISIQDQILSLPRISGKYKRELEVIYDNYELADYLKEANRQLNRYLDILVNIEKKLNAFVFNKKISK